MKLLYTTPLMAFHVGLTAALPPGTGKQNPGWRKPPSDAPIFITADGQKLDGWDNYVYAGERGPVRRCYQYKNDDSDEPPYIQGVSVNWSWEKGRERLIVYDGNFCDESAYHEVFVQMTKQNWKADMENGMTWSKGERLRPISYAIVGPV